MDWSSLLEQMLEEQHLPVAMLIFGAAYVVGTLLLLPAWIFPVAAGAAFGTRWGTAASLAAASLAAQCAFALARHLLRGRVERAARKRPTFAALDKAVKREPWKIVALLRLSPVLPSGLKSYFLGLTCVRPLTYAGASAAGMLPGIALKAYVGDAGRDALAGGGPLRWALLAAALAATVALSWIVGRVARKRMGL